LIKAVAGAIDLDGGIIHIGAQDHKQMTPASLQKPGGRGHLSGIQSGTDDVCCRKCLSGRQDRQVVTVDFKTMKSKTKEIFKLFNVDIDPDALVQDLSPAKQQIVEIAKAVRERKDLDYGRTQRSAFCSEVDHMFEIIRELKQRA